MVRSLQALQVDVALAPKQSTVAPRLPCSVSSNRCRIVQVLRSLPGLQVEIPPAAEPDEGAAAEHKRAGDQAFVHKRYEDAVAAYTRSLQHATGNPLVWANRSVAHLRANSPAEAFQDARRSRTLDPKYFKASRRVADDHTESSGMVWSLRFAWHGRLRCAGQPALYKSSAEGGVMSVT